MLSNLYNLKPSKNSIKQLGLGLGLLAFGFGMSGCAYQNIRFSKPSIVTKLEQILKPREQEQIRAEAEVRRQLVIKEQEEIRAKAELRRQLVIREQEQIRRQVMINEQLQKIKQRYRSAYIAEEIQENIFVQSEESIVTQSTDDDFPKTYRSNLESYLSMFEEIGHNRFYDKKYEKELLLDHKNTISRSASIYDIPKEIFTGLLVYEHGDRNSPTGKIGRGQMSRSSVDTAIQYVEKNNIISSSFYGITKDFTNKAAKNRILDSILHNDEANIEASSAYLAYMHSIFPDWSLAVSAYQLGPSIVADLVWFYKGAITEQWEPPFVIRKSLNKRSNQRFKYKGMNYDQQHLIGEFIENNGVNLNKILQSKATMNYYNYNLKPSRRSSGSKWYRLESYTPKVFHIARNQI